MTQKRLLFSLGVIFILVIFGTFLFLFRENAKPTDPNTILVPVTKNEIKQTIDTFVGTYTSDVLPSASSSGRIVTLILSAKGENPVASLSTNFLDDKNPITREGLWRVSDSKIVLTLSTHGETFIEDEGEEMYFNYKKDTLTMTDYNPEEWGSEGLILHRQRDAEPTTSIPNPLLETSWEWFGTEMSKGNSYTPKMGAFTLTFLNDTRFIASTDCNRLSGDYKISGDSSNQIIFSNITSTKKVCGKDSMEEDFLQMLLNINSLNKNDTELFFQLKDDSGIMTFKLAKPETIQPKESSPLDSETSDSPIPL